MRLFLTAFAVAFSFPLFIAAKPLATELEPINHTSANLVVVDASGAETAYDPAALEAMPTYQLTTTTPWRDDAARFDGIMLTDLLAAHGLTEVDEIRVTAENDFAVTIPREAWENLDILVATRVDGAPHTRRARGPIQFIIDDETYATSSLAEERFLVWMATRIEPVR